MNVSGANVIVQFRLPDIEFIVKVFVEDITPPQLLLEYLYVAFGANFIVAFPVCLIYCFAGDTVPYEELFVVALIVKNVMLCTPIFPSLSLAAA